MFEKKIIEKIKKIAYKISLNFINDEIEDIDVKFEVEDKLRESIKLVYSHTSVVIEETGRDEIYFFVRYEVRSEENIGWPLYTLDFEFSKDGKLLDEFFEKL